MTARQKGADPRKGNGPDLRQQTSPLNTANSNPNPTELSSGLQSALANSLEKQQGNAAELHEAITDQLAFILVDHKGNTASVQRDRVLAGLRVAPLTTLDFRKHLDVLHPAMRILELREDGYDIVTIRLPQETINGKRHNVAKFVLCSRDGDE